MKFSRFPLLALALLLFLGGGSLPAENPHHLKFVFQSAPYQYINVFGVHCAATNTVPRAKFRHMASVLAQYLDNDEDGVVDDPNIIAALTDPTRPPCLMALFKSEQEMDNVLNRYGNVIDQYRWQNLFANECHPQGSSMQNGFDATLEEVLHLVSQHGWANAYPAAFGEYSGTEIALAMDVARGGHFNWPPNNYPPGAWYHYDDPTCNYGCQVTEYFYWLVTSALGAQDYAGRGNEISNEWEPNTLALVRSTDLSGWALLTDPRFTFPLVLPDGNYR
jgi:hypothetical protein